MSEELEWELYDMFESGIFAFPIYEHNSARRIVRYLKMRGVLDEELAAATESSTVDLRIWLNRGGKRMVGEWVIAWMNDSREQYRHMRRADLWMTRRRRSSVGCGGEGWLYNDEDMSRGSTPDSDFIGDVDECNEVPIEAEHNFGGRGNSLNDDNRRRDTRTPSRSLSHPVGLDAANCNVVEVEISPRSNASLTLLSLSESCGDLEKVSATDSCLVSNSRQKRNKPTKLRFDQQSLKLTADGVDQRPDSGNVPDMCPCILVDYVRRSSLACDDHTDTDLSQSSNSLAIGNHIRFKLCPDCTCTLTHYIARRLDSVRLTSSCDVCISRQLQVIHNEEHTSLVALNPHDVADARSRTFPWFKRATSRCSVFESIRRETRGHLLILADINDQDNILWSDEHRYKITSTRLVPPGQRVVPSRSEDADLDLIWQVTVAQHIKAVKEVKAALRRYHVHTDWFRCSLSVVMAAVSTVVNKYTFV